MDLEKQKISLQDFLKQLSEGIESGVEGRQIKDCIKVELSVATKIDVGGKVKFYILNGGAGYQKEDTTRIIFEYYPKRKKINYQASPPSKKYYPNIGV